MAAPILFLFLPAAAAIALYLLRAWRVAAVGLAALVTLALAWVALAAPLNVPIGWLGGAVLEDTAFIMGRAFSIEDSDRLGLAFILAQAGLLFLLSGIGQPSTNFLPAGMAILGLLAASLFVRPFIFAAIFMQLAASAAVFMLADTADQSGGRSATRGALRYLVYATLGLPFILLTGWLLEAAAASPADPVFIGQATILLMFGFAILLAIAPFHSWIPALAEHAPPMASAYVFTVMRLAVLFLLLTFLDVYPWLGQNPVVYRGLILAGSGMALFGTIFTFGQRNFGRSMGYVLLIDFGAVMLGIGLGTATGVQAALVTMALRGLGLPLWAMGLEEMRREAGADTFEAARGFGRRSPLAAAAILVGMLSLAGFPLTAGFVGRWGLLYQLTQIHPTAAIILLLGTVSASLVIARGLAALLTPADGTDRPKQSLLPGRLATGLYGLGFTIVLALGLFPQWLLPLVADTASAFIRQPP
jgi:NADH:ubiquinone oxidoreductase subunit 2 (subunit N)